MRGTSTHVDTKSMTHRFTINRFTALERKFGVLTMTTMTKMLPGTANKDVTLRIIVVTRYVTCEMWNKWLSISFVSMFFAMIVDSIVGREPY